MYTLGNIKSLVFEKKIFIELCPVVAAILDFQSTQNTYILSRTIKGWFQPSIASKD
jgi:hypothetical protein